MPEFKSSPVERAETLESLVRQHADDADQNCRLPAPVAAGFAEQGLYRIGAPRAYLGEEADPMTQIKTIETISRFDGSAGWNLMIGVEIFGLSAPGCASCSYLLEDPKAIMCGSTAAVGRAEKVAGGYVVSGDWQFVSGCHNGTVFSATVEVIEDGESLPGTAAAMIVAPDFEIKDTWHVGGMRGSGSHDVTVRDVLIPEEQLVPRIGTAASEHPLMRFPLTSRLSYNKVAVATGIARAGLDAFVELAAGKHPRFSSSSLKDRPSAQSALAEAEVLVLSARTLVLNLVEDLWEKVIRREAITLKERAVFQIACSDAVARCVSAVDLIADAAGTSANFRSHPLERISRDVRVVRQHATVASHHIEDGGRVLMGLEPTGVMLQGL